MVCLGFSLQAAEPVKQPWYTPLKDIKAGPGRFDLGFNLRVRYEYLDNFNILHYGTGTADDVLLLRARLSADYRLTGQAHTFVEFQHARYWLSDLALSDFGRSCTYYDEFDLRQAYLEWKQIGESPFGVKLGRQILLYADRRLFAPAEWGNVGNYWWDAAKLCYETDPIALDVIYGQRVLTGPKDWNFDHWPHHMGAVYARVKQLPVTLDVFYVIKHDWSGNAKGESGTGNETRHTFGLFPSGPLAMAGTMVCSLPGWRTSCPGRSRAFCWQQNSWQPSHATGSAAAAAFSRRHCFSVVCAGCL